MLNLLEAEQRQAILTARERRDDCLKLFVGLKADYQTLLENHKHRWGPEFNHVGYPFRKCLICDKLLPDFVINRFKKPRKGRHEKA